MQRHAGRTSSGSKPPADLVGRSDHHTDDRPFAEIRRLVFDGLRLFSLHRWIFFVPFCLVSCAAFIGSFYVPRTYEATTSFEVKNDPVMINLPISAGAASYKYFRNTMVRDLTSVEAMGEVVENLEFLDQAETDADGNLTPSAVRRRESLARSLGAKLNITTNSPSELVDVVRITYTGEDPALGRKLVDEVKRTYIRRTGLWLHDFLNQQRDYFLREAQDAAAEMLAAQREETKLRLENPHVNPADPGSVSVRLSQLESERRDLLLRKREYDAELAAQKQILLAAHGDSRDGAAPLANHATHPVLLALAGQIHQVEQKALELRRLRGVTDQHPDMADLLSKRELLREQLAQQEETLISSPADFAPQEFWAAFGSGLPNTTALSGEQARLGMQIAAQAEKIKEIDIALQTNQLAIDQLQKAKDQVFEKQEEFAAVLGRVQKAKARQMQVDGTLAQIEPAIKAVQQNRLLQFSEGSPAQGGFAPVSPKAATVVLLAVVAGLVAGAIFVVLAEVLDHVYRSSGQVARSLGLPLLEAIDEIVTPHDRRRMLFVHAVITPIVVIICLGTTGLTGSIAYLSLAKPAAYEKVRHIPDSVLKLFIETREAAKPLMGVPDEV